MRDVLTFVAIVVTAFAQAALVAALPEGAMQVAVALPLFVLDATVAPYLITRQYRHTGRQVTR